MQKHYAAARMRIQSPSVLAFLSYLTFFPEKSRKKTLRVTQTCRSVCSMNKTRVWLTVGNRTERDRGRGGGKGKRDGKKKTENTRSFGTLASGKFDNPFPGL